MKVSVIVPAYNAGETIAETLQSLSEQTFQGWEAVVVDDGSTDQTASIVADFAKRDKRIRYVRQSRSGGSAARNKGVRLAKFDWLLFLDADDWILPQHLERLTTMLASDPTLDAVHCGWTRVDAEGGFSPEKFAPDTDDLFPAFAQSCAFQPNTCIIRRAAVEAVKGFDTSLFNCQDWDFWQRITRTGARFGAVHEVLARHRTRPGSLSLQAVQLLENGLRMITQGHSPDSRVVNAKPAYAHGMPEADLAKARLHFACWPAGIVLGSGQDAQPLLDIVKYDREPQLEPARVASLLFEAALLPSALPMNGWDRLWSQIGQNVARFLQSLEQLSGTVELADHSLRYLEQLIIEHSELGRPLTIGATHAIQVEVTQPTRDIIPPPATKRLRCELQMEGEGLGTIELPVNTDLVTSDAIADAIAAIYAWPILGRFFEHTLYPALQIERKQSKLLLWRGSVCLGEGIPETEDISWNTIHDLLGWVLFLQELWGYSEWTSDKFYDPKHREAPTPSTRFTHSPLALEVSDVLLDVVTADQSLDLAVTVGGAPLGCVTIPARHKISAQEIRVAITVFGGFDLCRLAVRQGLLGKPLTATSSLRERLITRVQKQNSYSSTTNLSSLVVAFRRITTSIKAELARLYT